jgi:hypothetical protein
MLIPDFTTHFRGAMRETKKVKFSKTCVECTHFELSLGDYKGEYCITHPKCKCAFGIWDMNYGDSEHMFRSFIEAARICEQYEAENE